ncbi:NUDIX domain-containing protein [Kitasatospora sp. NPDC056181]|uniref:NUDIX domain-containing protein n=1 Tax=Kitasatospora sp. NPDC056181 TaxID=3345737 RepID=UPI0035DA1383
MNPRDDLRLAASPASGTDPLTLVVGVHLVLTNADRVLLGRRRNTAYAKDLWHLPPGHMERGKPVTRSITREAEEELGITIAEDDLALVHTLHHLDADDGRSRLQLWWPLDSLPDDTVPYTAHALAEITRGSTLNPVA